MNYDIHVQNIKRALEENRKRIIENNKQKTIDKITKRIKTKARKGRNVRKCY